MYGISNSQQGGGGGSAASYKAIKSALTSSDWQELGTRPYFVGENAMEWPIDSGTEMPMKINSSDLGIIAGQQYTITIKADAVEYSSTATAEENGGMLFLQFLFPEEAAAFVMIYDHADWEAKAPGNGSLCAVESAANSLVITKFNGEGFGTIVQTTISDSAIKVNSAVTVYVNTSEKIEAGEKTDGSVILTVPSIPTADIPYSLEIVGTDSEGLFELVNGYVLDISDIPTVEIPTSLPQKTSGTKVATWRKGESSTQVNDSDITETSDIVVEVSCEKEIIGNITTGAFILRFYDYPSPDENISFTYKVKQTDGEGQLVIVNRYVPSVPTKTSDLQNDSGFLTKDNFVAGDNITITNENDNLIISATGGASSELVTTLKGTEIIKTFDNLDGCELIKGDTVDGYIYC